MLPPSLKELENSLNRVYLRIFKAINREDDYPDNIAAIQRKYNKIVYDNTRSAIQQAVILANEKVNRLFKTQPYLTQKDLNLIEKNTKDQVDSFWRKIILDIFRKQEQRLMGGAAIGDVEDDVSLEPPPDLEHLTGASELSLFVVKKKKSPPKPIPPDLDMTNALQMVTTAAIYTTFADATITKTGQLADTIEQKPKFLWIARLDEKTCIELPNGEPGCAALNGTGWAYDDPSIPVPGELGSTGTHPHCRCFIDLIMPEDPRYGRLDVGY
jgi:hypothetical protein